MNRSSLKSSIFLITYGIVLYLVLSHIGLVAGAGSYSMTVVRPVIIGVVMAYVINLLMRPMETKWLAGLWRRCPRLARGKRGLCIVLSILGVLAIITALCLFILPQVGESLLSLANSIPGYLADAGDFFNGLESRLDMENEIISYLWKQGEELINQSGTLIKNFVGSAATWLLSFVTGLASGIINGFLGIIFAIYILADKEHLNYIYHRLLRAIFKDSIRERIEYIVRKIDRAFGGFISGQLIEACILGSLCFVGLTIVGLFVGGMPYALLISVLVGATSIIPILGAYLSAIPSALLILLISPVKALIFVIFLVVLQQFEGNVIYPRVVGGSIGIGGMWVLLALTVGGNLMGITGMVLGIPAFAVIYALVKEFCDKRIAAKDAAIDRLLDRSRIMEAGVAARDDRITKQNAEIKNVRSSYKILVYGLCGICITLTFVWAIYGILQGPKKKSPPGKSGRGRLFFGQGAAAVGAGIAALPAQVPAAVGAAQHRKVEGCGGKSQQDHRAAEEEVIGQGERHGAHQHGDD